MLSISHGAAAAVLVDNTYVKNHLKIQHAGEDTQLTNVFIPVAIDMMENYLGRALVNRTVTVIGDLYHFKNPYKLPYPNVTTFTSFTVYHRDDTNTVVASTNYMLDGSGRELAFKTWNGYVFPTNLRPVHMFQAVYTAGYGANATDVPDRIRLAVAELCGILMNNREAERIPMPQGLRNQVARYKVAR